MDLNEVDIRGRIIIGGSPSTGSSLLRRILNRHSQIFSGEESSLFTKVQLYDDWNLNKSRLFKSAVFGLRSFGWHHYTGVDLDYESYGWNNLELKDLVDKSISFRQFADQVFSRKLLELHKNIWIEKTPSNCFLFNRFQNEFGGKTIHIVRNPLDTIASLVSRGFNIYEAVSRYLIFVSFGLKVEASTNHLVIGYEDMIIDTEAIIAKVCKFIGVEFESAVLNSSKSDSKTKSKMRGWNFDETAAIASENTNRFEKMDERTQDQIKYAIQKIQLKGQYLKYHNLNCENIISAYQLLGYPLNFDANHSKAFDIKSQRRKDVFFRTRKLYEDHLFNYPICIV